MKGYVSESYASKSLSKYKQYFDNFSYIVVPKINDHLNGGYFLISKRLVVFSITRGVYTFSNEYTREIW